jgi:hypothetical protein
MKMPNGGVDAAARFQSTFAGRINLRNTLPPLASNDLLGRTGLKITFVYPAWASRLARCEFSYVRLYSLVHNDDRQQQLIAYGVLAATVFSICQISGV